jgi:hypothetical protein
MSMLQKVISKLTVKDLPQLAKSITDDYTTGQRCAVSMCYNIGYAWEIWHQRDDDDGFWEWLENETPTEIGAKRKAEKYLQVYRNVLADSTTENIKDVPFGKLLTLAATAPSQRGEGGRFKQPKPALPKQKRDSLLKQLTSDNPPTTQQIKDEVKKVLPKVTPIKPVQFIWPTFSVRLSECLHDDHMSPTKAARLFAMSHEANEEDIRIIAKHWKHKYHPDKGGTTEEFNLICRAEEVFIDSQNGKVASA